MCNGMESSLLHHRSGDYENSTQQQSYAGHTGEYLSARPNMRWQ